MKTEIKIGDKIYQIEISETKEGLLKVSVNEKEFFFKEDELGELNFVSPKPDFSEELKKSEVIFSTKIEKEIRSPLAGVISSIAVKKNEQIKPGQKVATLISMKMENEIISEGGGKIKEIKVKEGQFVNKGDVLIILD